MKIVVYGASGMIGSRVVKEALNRGHEVTAVVRDPSRLDLSGERVRAVQGDVLDAASVAEVAAGQDAVVNAVRPVVEPGQPAHYTEAARALVDGLRGTGVRRLIYVGGASSLEVAPGEQLYDASNFNPDWRPDANAQRDALAFFRASDTDLDWTYFSPAAIIAPGERTGSYRSGGDQLVTDANGQSRISAEDYAVALVDELEKPAHLRQRFTVAY